MTKARIALIALALFSLSTTTWAQGARMNQVIPPKVHVIAPDKIRSIQVTEKASAAPVSSYTVSVSQTRIKAGGFSPHHNHPDEEIIVLVSGKVKVHTPDGERILEPGGVLVIEAYAEHQLEALEDAYLVEAFGPGRGVRPNAPRLSQSK